VKGPYFVTGAQVSDVTGELDVPSDGHRDVLDGVDKLGFLMSTASICYRNLYSIHFRYINILITSAMIKRNPSNLDDIYI